MIAYDLAVNFGGAIYTELNLEVVRIFVHWQIDLQLDSFLIAYWEKIADQKSCLISAFAHNRDIKLKLIQVDWLLFAKTHGDAVGPRLLQLDFRLNLRFDHALNIVVSNTVGDEGNIAGYITMFLLNPGRVLDELPLPEGNSRSNVVGSLQHSASVELELKLLNVGYLSHEGTCKVGHLAANKSAGSSGGVRAGWRPITVAEPELGIFGIL